MYIIYRLNQGKTFVKSAISVSKMHMMEVALQKLLAGSPKKPPPPITVNFSKRGLGALMRWLGDRIIWYQRADGTRCDNGKDACTMTILRMALLTQNRILKEKQLYVLGYSNSGKTTLSDLMKHIYPKCFSVALESNPAFTAKQFYQISSTSIWLDSEVTPEMIKAHHCPHLNMVLEGDLCGEVAVKHGDSQVIIMSDIYNIECLYIPSSYLCIFNAVCRLERSCALARKLSHRESSEV